MAEQARAGGAGCGGGQDAHRPGLLPPVRASAGPVGAAAGHSARAGGGGRGRPGLPRGLAGTPPHASARFRTLPQACGGAARFRTLPHASARFRTLPHASALFRTLTAVPHASARFRTSPHGGTALFRTVTPHSSARSHRMLPHGGTARFRTIIPHASARSHRTCLGARFGTGHRFWRGRVRARILNPKPCVRNRPLSGGAGGFRARVWGLGFWGVAVSQDQLQLLEAYLRDSKLYDEARGGPIGPPRGPTWSSLVPLGSTWSHLVPLGPTWSQAPPVSQWAPRGPTKSQMVPPGLRPCGIRLPRCSRPRIGAWQVILWDLAVLRPVRWEGEPAPFGRGLGSLGFEFWSNCGRMLFEFRNPGAGPGDPHRGGAHRAPRPPERCVL